MFSWSKVRAANTMSFPRHRPECEDVFRLISNSQQSMNSSTSSNRPRQNKRLNFPENIALFSSATMRCVWKLFNFQIFNSIERRIVLISIFLDVCLKLQHNFHNCLHSRESAKVQFEFVILTFTCVQTFQSIDNTVALDRWWQNWIYQSYRNSNKLLRWMTNDTNDWTLVWLIQTPR